MSDPEFQALRRRLADAAPPARLDQPCYVYGAGGFGRRIARALQDRGVAVRGFIDRRAAEIRCLDGLPCVPPDGLAPADLRGCAYVHGLMNHYAASDDVAAWAAEAGFARLVFPAALAALGLGIDQYWLAAPGATLAALDRIEALHGRLADAESRSLLRAILAYRLETDPRRHPPVEAGSIYRPDFLDLGREPITFVDCGAFTGDSLSALVEAGIAVADWLAFEPDPANMRALAETARRHNAVLGSYSLIRAGLSDEAGTAAFHAGEGAASHLAESGEGPRIDLVRLDDVARRAGRLYIKLDIEGAEAAALRGMAAHLARRPLLAVSAYHRPADLWELPELIAELYPRPVLRLRQHGHHAFDTVLYATPD